MDPIFILRIVGVVAFLVGVALLFAAWPRINRRVKQRIDREVKAALRHPLPSERFEQADGGDRYREYGIKFDHRRGEW